MALWEMNWKLIVTKFALASERLEVLLKQMRTTKQLEIQMTESRCLFHSWCVERNYQIIGKEAFFLLIKIER